jgi:anti-sigma B factor antagonist
MHSRPIKPLMEVEKVGDVAVVRFLQQRLLHPEMIEDATRQLEELAEHAPCSHFVLHFGNVESMTSAMAGKLVGLQRKVSEAGGELVLCEVGAFLMEIFKILKLPRVLRIYADEQQALQSFSGH